MDGKKPGALPICGHYKTGGEDPARQTVWVIFWTAKTTAKEGKEPTKKGKTTAKQRQNDGKDNLQSKHCPCIYTHKKETAPESRLTYKRPGQKITPPSAYGSGTHRQRSWQEVREQPRRVSTCGSWRSPPDIRPGDRKEPRARSRPPHNVCGAQNMRGDRDGRGHNLHTRRAGVCTTLFGRSPH